MPTKPRNSGELERWTALDGYLHLNLPDLAAWWASADSFSELRLKARDDGTTLAIAKGYGPDGGPVVCFGVGYGVTLSLMALSSSMRGGNWKVDKPWRPSEK